jgi:hypothetical protein
VVTPVTSAAAAKPWRWRGAQARPLGPSDKSTPLRYAELQVGFDARGFEQRERDLGYPIERTF